MKGDEITTDGFGMTVIEMICLCGILKAIPIGNTNTEWVWDERWETQTMYLLL